MEYALERPTKPSHLRKCLLWTKTTWWSLVWRVHWRDDGYQKCSTCPSVPHRSITDDERPFVEGSWKRCGRLSDHLVILWRFLSQLGEYLKARPSVNTHTPPGAIMVNWIVAWRLSRPLQKCSLHKGLWGAAGNHAKVTKVCIPFTLFIYTTLRIWYRRSGFIDVYPFFLL